jgi:pimeloyl-ACP methyl ester carboxylesterase
MMFMLEPIGWIPNMAPFAHKVIRTLFGAGEHVAPSLTGRIAFELFCRTSNPNKLGERESKAVARAAGLLAEARKHCLTTRTGNVTAFEFRPLSGESLGTVLVIHGWASRTEYMKPLIESYRDAGYRVVALDLPGHGHSSGRRLTMLHALDAARVVGEWFGPFAAIAGHSFGGAVAANAVAGTVNGIPPLAAERLVLIAAPSSMPAIFEDFARLLNVGPRSYRVMAAQVERLTGRPLEDFVASREFALSQPPTLVIHSPDDREVSADHARMYAASGDHVRLHWAEGLGHRRILSDAGVARLAVSFLAEPPRQALVA